MSARRSAAPDQPARAQIPMHHTISSVDCWPAVRSMLTFDVLCPASAEGADRRPTRCARGRRTGSYGPRLQDRTDPTAAQTSRSPPSLSNRRTAPAGFPPRFIFQPNIPMASPHSRHPLPPHGVHTSVTAPAQPGSSRPPFEATVHHTPQAPSITENLAHLGYQTVRSHAPQYVRHPPKPANTSTLMSYRIEAPTALVTCVNTITAVQGISVGPDRRRLRHD